MLAEFVANNTPFRFSIKNMLSAFFPLPNINTQRYDNGQ